MDADRHARGDDAMTDDATTDGATTDGATTDGATTVDSRRSSGRFPLHVPVRLRPCGTDRWERGRTVSVSETGAGIRFDRVGAEPEWLELPDPGSDFELELSPDSSSGPLRLIVHLVWVQPADADLAGDVGGAGVRFVGMSGRDRSRLCAWLGLDR